MKWLWTWGGKSFGYRDGDMNRAGFVGGSGH